MRTSCAQPCLRVFGYDAVVVVRFVILAASLIEALRRRFRLGMFPRRIAPVPATRIEALYSAEFACDRGRGGIFPAFGDGVASFAPAFITAAR